MNQAPQMSPTIEPSDAPARPERRFPWFVVVVVGALAGAWWWMGRPTSAPAFFDASMTLDDAMAKQRGTDKIVFAYATADWCPPCKHFKATTLADARVMAWMEANAVPVYIDVDKRPEDATRLSVRSIPAYFVIVDGNIIDSAVGAQPTESFLGWIQSARDAAMAQR